MKLGLWNRLALVLGILGTVGFPAEWIIRTNWRHSRVMQSGYETCIAEKRDTMAQVYSYCSEIWLENRSGYISWNAWLEALPWSAAAMVAIYAIIWLVVKVVKWVWRGKNTTTA